MRQRTWDKDKRFEIFEDVVMKRDTMKNVDSRGEIEIFEDVVVKKNVGLTREINMFTVAVLKKHGTNIMIIKG